MNSYTSEPTTKLPLGPRGTWRVTMQLIRDPRKAMEKWVRDYGDPFFLQALNGPVVVTGREDLIRTIYGQDPCMYSPFATDTLRPIMGEDSIFVIEGDQHRQERKLMSPMFHGERMKAYGQLMQETARRHLEQRRGRAKFSTLELMTDLSLEIIVRAIFGGDDPSLVQRMMAASRTMVARANPILFFTQRAHVSFFGLSPFDRWKAGHQMLSNLFDEVIAKSKGDDERQDILSLLCRVRDDQGQGMARQRIHTELMTLLFAGHETSALTLTWAIYHLHRNRRVLNRLRSELDSYAELTPEVLASAPYLKAVIQETLRMNPIITETLRKLNRPLTLGDYSLPSGMGLAIATVLAHYNPTVWDEPDVFNPDRFLEKNYSPFVYMPFGGGHRRCLGAPFASYEMAMVLGVLLREYEFELCDDTEVVPKRKSVTMGPSTEVPIRLIGERR